MPYEVSLTCPKCAQELETAWTFGEDVTCPRCLTDLEVDGEGDGVGGLLVWVVGERKISKG